MRLLYAITGRPGIGKTTVALKVSTTLKKHGLKIDGMYTMEVREGGVRKGFKVVRIGGGEGILAWKDHRGGPRVGRYTVNLRDLEEVGVRGIIEGVERADFVVVDEVGPMELYSQRFREAVKNLLSSTKPALITVHYRSRDPLIQEVKRAAGGNLIILDEENRGRVPDIIVGDVLRLVSRE